MRWCDVDRCGYWWRGRDELHSLQQGVVSPIRAEAAACTSLPHYEFKTCIDIEATPTKLQKQMQMLLSYALLNTAAYMRRGYVTCETVRSG